MRHFAIVLLTFGLLLFFVVPFAGSLVLGLGVVLVLLIGGDDDDD